LGIQPAEAAGILIIDLAEKDCTKTLFDYRVKNDNPIMVFGCGHGNQTLFTGQNGFPLLSRGRPEDHQLMMGRCGSFLSCSFGFGAPYWVAQGMRGFYGYSRTFYFMIISFPNYYAEWFFKAHYAFDQALFKGRSWEEAWADSDVVWKDFLPRAPAACQRHLLWDYESRIKANEPGYTPFKPAPPPPPKYICPWDDFEGSAEEVKAHIKADHAPYLVDACILPQPIRGWIRCKLP